MENQYKEKIMIVDDDRNILQSFERVFRKLFNLRTVDNPLEAITVFQEEGPFAVVVSDMHMPGMDGIALLTKLREIYPDSVRIMLTGDADVRTAVNAVNEGNIFRFLVKPCEAQLMGHALFDAIKQHQLITAEHELLEKTLKGSIKILTDILSMTNPVAFNKARRISDYTVQIVTMMNLPNVWQYEIAALLSQIGCITIPLETVDKYFSGIELAEAEKAMIAAHPSVGYDLLINIPRMQSVAAMIKLQNQLLPKEKYQRPQKDLDPVAFGGLLLRSCIEFELLMTKNTPIDVIYRKMSEGPTGYIPELMDSFRKIEIMVHGVNEFKYVKIPDLVDDMVLSDAIISRNGMLIVGKGCIINAAIRQRLTNFMKQDIIENVVKIAM